MPAIVPKSKAPGIDFCGVNIHFYIIRSDLGCYMVTTNFNKGENINIYRLHNSCQGGDHYLADEYSHFYIIKGNSFRRVLDLNRDDDAVVCTLHPNWRGGDHYFSAYGNFYVAFLSKGIYRRCKDMTTDKEGIDFTLHPNCRNGLYYWGITGEYYFFKPQDEWGVQFVRCKDFEKNQDAVTYSFHASVVNFMPGGLAITRGPSYGKWEAIKTISNDSNSPITWNKKITKKVGYTKQKMSSTEHHWNVCTSATYQSGALTEALAKYQFSVTAEYGGSSVNTEQEEWSEATEIEESINVPLQPGEKMYIWQYQLGLGKEPVLFCRDMKFTKDSSPPTNIPLPSSHK